MSGFGLFLARAFFWLRTIMLIGSVGAMVGAFLMFWQGGLYLIHAWDTLIGSDARIAVDGPADHGEPADTAHTEVTQVTVQVLEAVDSFLFGVVLVIFAYSIAVGFVFRLPEHMARSLPSWMKVTGVGQLKQILAEVVIVVLIVIFARVVVESGGRFDWTMLVLPGSILALAAAIWLLELDSHGEAAHPPAASGGTSGAPTDSKEGSH